MAQVHVVFLVIFFFFKEQFWYSSLHLYFL
jgi:hypothetical protein